MPNLRLPISSDHLSKSVLNTLISCVISSWTTLYRDPWDPAAMAAIPAIPTQQSTLRPLGVATFQTTDADLPPNYKIVEFPNNWGIQELPPSYDECVKNILGDIV